VFLKLKPKDQQAEVAHWAALPPTFLTAFQREQVGFTIPDEKQDEASELAIVDDQDSELRNRIVMMMSDLQWRGLTVRVTGSGSGIYRVEAAIVQRVHFDSPITEAEARNAELDNHLHSIHVGEDGSCEWCSAREREED